MTEQDILNDKNEIEKKIGYQFNNKKLLVQAFTRKSFAVENDGFEDNEVLEFYGDQLVNTVMTKWLYDKFSTVPNPYQDDFFYSQRDESELSKSRMNYISKAALSHCINISGLYKYLLLGKSDERNEVWKSEKVQCDLFEAIIGAVAVDSSKRTVDFNRNSHSDWDFDTITKSCKALWGMLHFDEDYIEMLEDMCENMNISKPNFQTDSSGQDGQPFKCKVSLYIQNNCQPETFEGTGSSELSAKMEAAKNALTFLHEYQIEQIIGNATPENAVSALNTLYLKKYISKPEYNCSVSPDDDGNQIWCCECFIKEYEAKEGYNSAGIGEEYTKSEAKAAAAYDMICFILGKENTYQDAENEPYGNILDDGYGFDDDD